MAIILENEPTIPPRDRSSDPRPDRRIIVCNTRRARSYASKGALCYLLFDNPGNARERLLLLERSRGGRFIEHYEAIRDVVNFRVQTISADHPLYFDRRIMTVASIDRIRDSELRDQADSLNDQSRAALKMKSNRPV